MKVNSKSNIQSAVQLAIFQMENIQPQVGERCPVSIYLKAGIDLIASTQKPIQSDDQLKLVQRMNAELENTYTQFKEHVGVLQIALQNDLETLYSLNIQKISSNKWARVRQAAYFYRQIQAQNLNLENYGISKGEIQQSSAEVEALLEMKKECARKKKRLMKATPIII
uniref:Uncharacterized protein n=1 Tax=Roseihalotalea indica TaxID=2867963 RepID=A0AA49PZS7_9BACT|nr:hypothetical protein K4G66_15810 [Tunicatimonas sp. TK19036]